MAERGLTMPRIKIDWDKALSGFDPKNPTKLRDQARVQMIANAKKPGTVSASNGQVLAPDATPLASKIQIIVLRPLAHLKPHESWICEIRRRVSTPWTSSGVDEVLLPPHEAWVNEFVFQHRSPTMPPPVVLSFEKWRAIAREASRLLVNGRVDLDDVLSESRTYEVSLIRHLTAYLMYHDVRLASGKRLSSFKIGDELGRDHTSIIHARKRIQKLINTDPEFAEKVGRVRASYRSLGTEQCAAPP